MNTSAIVNAAHVHLPRFVRLPRLYSPGFDSHLLTDAVLNEIISAGQMPSVLELCAGTGYLSVAAALAGADVTALDISARAATNVRLNARINRVDVRVLRADVRQLPELPRFDLVVANPPYVPALSDDLPTTGSALAYDAGLDGRALIDPVCKQAAGLLKPGGSVILVQSEVNGVDRTCALLRRSGLVATVVGQQSIPLGPLMSARAEMLESRGLLAPGQRTECISVIRGTRPIAPSPQAGRTDDLPADQEPTR